MNFTNYFTTEEDVVNNIKCFDPNNMVERFHRAREYSLKCEKKRRDMRMRSIDRSMNIAIVGIGVCTYMLISLVVVYLFW